MVENKLVITIVPELAELEKRNCKKAGKFFTQE